MTQYVETQSPGRIREIDTLRCFAMTAVVAQHCHLFPSGWLGVWLFFVVSGFVVTSAVTGSSDRAGPGRRLIDFYIRRAARIQPIYYAYVAGAFLVWWAMASQFNFRPLLSLMFFYDNAEMPFSGGELRPDATGHLWTISAEMQFYLLFGVALVMLDRRRLSWLLIALLALGPSSRLVATFALPHWFQTDEALAYAVYASPGLHFDAFAAGGLLALNARWIAVPRNALRLMLIGVGLLAAFVLTYAYVNYAAGARSLEVVKNIISGILWGQYRQVFLYSAIAAASAGLVAMAVARHPLLQPILGQRALQYVGEISYGAYVYHAALVALVAACWQSAFPQLSSVPVGLLTFAVAYPVTLAVAHLSARYIERPIIAAAGAWTRRKPPTSKPLHQVA